MKKMSILCTYKYHFILILVKLGKYLYCFLMAACRENKNIDFAGLSYSCGCFTFILLVGGVRMYIGVTGKRYRAAKEVGKVNMSVGIIAYYQVMQVCQVNYNL